jgi:hypothetical protein
VPGSNFLITGSLKFPTRVVIQYVLIVAVTAFLLWLSLRSIHVEEGRNKWDYILETWNSADKIWLILMLFSVLLSHVIRAERWRMLLQSTNHQTSLYKGFLSLMVGYLVNLVVPRGGEVSRCYNLYRLDKIPVEVSFGTVVVERIIDLVCLVIVLLLAFSFESEKLFGFISTLPVQAIGTNKLLIALSIFLLFILFSSAIIWWISRNKSIKARLIQAWHGFKNGLLSISRIEHKALFISYTLLIWVLYFAMSYTVLQAFDETAHLGIRATLSVFAIGAIAMSVPLPGGAGSYHVLVPAGMVLLYQLQQDNAVAFTFIFHGWQTIIMIAGGAISLLLTAVYIRKKTD